jgi:deazaflavin-dependent oxidoreductase (nitroreductase family)
MIPATRRIGEDLRQKYDSGTNSNDLPQLTPRPHHAFERPRRTWRRAAHGATGTVAPQLAVAQILIDPSWPARTSTEGEDMDRNEFNEWNKKIIEEFRANGGKVGGQYADAPILLLYTKGRRSGKELLNPLAYYADGDRYLVFGSKGGADTHPDWYLNLVAAPTAHIEVGTESFDVRVTELQDEERDRLYTAQAEVMPNFAEYQANTKRVIPVVALSRV